MVFGTLEDLSEMQMSSKSKRLSRETWYSALSTIASGVGEPYFARISFSIEPELTPMRIGMFFLRHISATALTRSSEPMLPGLMRIALTPASAAASASR